MRVKIRSWKGVVVDSTLRSVRHSPTHRYKVFAQYREEEGETGRLVGVNYDYRVNFQDADGSWNQYPRSTEELKTILRLFKEGRRLRDQLLLAGKEPDCYQCGGRRYYDGTACENCTKPIAL